MSSFVDRKLSQLYPSPSTFEDSFCESFFQVLDLREVGAIVFDQELKCMKHN